MAGIKSKLGKKDKPKKKTPSKEDEFLEESEDEELEESQSPHKQIPQQSNPITEMLGKKEEAKNPLESVEKAGAEVKKPRSGGKLDAEVLKEMMATGDNTDGMFQPDNPEPTLTDEVKEEVADEAKVETTGEVKEKGSKYLKLFADELADKPGAFQIDTPKGRMSLNKALNLGYNPITKKFDKKSLEEELNGIIGQANDADQEAIINMLNPGNAQIAQADASKFGLDSTSPMVKGGGMPAAPMSENPVAMMGGGVPPMGGAPDPGILAMLGGKK